MNNNKSVLDRANYHIADPNWLHTPDGERRGYIQPQSLSELWFHTGTVCNLSCPFCFEGSHPKNNRLQPLTPGDIRPFVAEAIAQGTKQFSFTGGEPFVIPEMIDILDYALDFNPCFVLTNATKPLLNRLDQLQKLSFKSCPLSFRVSLDYPDAEMHDRYRGTGNFTFSLKMMGELYRKGFKISVARRSERNEDKSAVDAAYVQFFRQAGLPEDTHVISFSDLKCPGARPNVPQITEHCMTTFKTREERARFMCNYSKMIVKKDGRMRVYACTLVDDDSDYDLGETLTETMRVRIMLRHHRCFGCFSAGNSCSEGKQKE